MVVVRFLIEFSDQNVVTVPVAISDTRSKDGHAPLKDFIQRLREKCGIRGTLELRHKNGSKVNAQDWSPTKDDGDFLYGIVDEPASDAALQYRDSMCSRIRSQSQIGKAPHPPPPSSSSSNSAPAANEVTKIDPMKSTGNSRVQVLNDDDESEVGQKKPGAAPAAAAASSSASTNQQQQHAPAQNNGDDSEDDDDYDPRGGEHVAAPDAVHFIAHTQTGNFTTVSKVAGAHGGVLFTEQPLLSPMYPSSLVELVRHEPRLRNWVKQLDMAPEAGGRVIEKMESTMFGLSSWEYSQYLYCAKRRGHTLPAKKDEDCEVAFYSVADSISHSCCPSAFMRFKKARVDQEEKDKKASERTGGGGDNDDGDAELKPRKAEEAANKATPSPSQQQLQQIAVVRCAKYAGITAGEMLHVALPRVAVMDFFLLPTPRRRRVLAEQYLLKGECCCERCTGRVSEGQSTLEVALTGAFFEGGPTEGTQAFLAKAMKKDFDDLKIMAPSTRPGADPLLLSVNARAGNIPADRVQKLYDFVVKYTHNLHVPPHLQHHERAAAGASQCTEKDENSSAAACAADHDEQQQQQPADEQEDKNKNNNKKQQQQEHKILLHPHHWRLSLVRIALLAFLFPPERCRKIPRVSPVADLKADVAGLPTKHSSVKLDQLVVRMNLAQLEVESAALAKNAGCAHPVLRRSYVVLRYILALLPEKLSADVQIQARSLPSVDWTMLEKIAAL